MLNFRKRILKANKKSIKEIIDTYSNIVDINFKRKAVDMLYKKLNNNLLQIKN